MLRVLWRLTKGYRLTPWNSPYLRWRLETYTGVHADGMGFKVFCGLSWQYRKEFVRYLGWAARMTG
jgi:uncharacterized Fe-S cluster-containing radical SAM superfamily protein